MCRQAIYSSCAAPTYPLSQLFRFTVPASLPDWVNKLNPAGEFMKILKQKIEEWIEDFIDMFVSNTDLLCGACTKQTEAICCHALWLRPGQPHHSSNRVVPRHHGKMLNIAFVII
jgi:hypothetical protein